MLFLKNLILHFSYLPYYLNLMFENYILVKLTDWQIGILGDWHISFVDLLFFRLQQLQQLQVGQPKLCVPRDLTTFEVSVRC